MKVVIGNPACRRPVGDGLERYMMGSGVRFPWSLLKRENERPRFSMFPMFLGYAAGALERAGFEVAVVDAVPLNLTEDEFRRGIIDAAPDIIVMEPNSAMMVDVAEHVAKLHAETNATMVLVGSHVTARTRETFKDCPALSYAVRGEFEHGLVGLLTALRDAREPAEIPGIAYRSEDGSVSVPEGLATPVDDLDALPMPARHLFPAWFDTDMGAYHDGFNQFAPAFDVHATRGCPYHCNFCVWVQVLFDEGKQRRRSPAAVVDEMIMLRDTYGAREIYFDDDNFTANRKFVNELCDELLRRDVQIPWSALADAIALNSGLLERMAEAGCIGVKFGLDSADSEVLRATDKPLKVSNVAPLVETAKRLGVKTHMTVVLGLSGETKESLNRTFKFSCDLDIDSIQYSLATPIPGTRLYDGLEASGRLTLGRWDELDGYSTSVIAYDDFTNEYIEGFMRDVHSRWLRARLRHPTWVARQTKYLVRLARVHGPKGVARRIRRGLQVVAGDTVIVGKTGSRRVLRF